MSEEFHKTEETEQMNIERLSDAVTAESRVANINILLPEKVERLALLRDEVVLLEKEVQTLNKSKEYNSERANEVRNRVAWQGEVMATEDGSPLTVLGENHPLEYYKRQIAELNEDARSKIESTKAELSALGVEVLGEEVINGVYPVLLVRLGDKVGAITDVRMPPDGYNESVRIYRGEEMLKELALSDINFRYGEFSQDPERIGRDNPARTFKAGSAPDLPHDYEFPGIEEEKENFKNGILRLTEIAKSNGLDVVLVGEYRGQSRAKDKSLWNDSPDIGGGVVVAGGYTGVAYDLEQQKIIDGEKVEINTGYEQAEKHRQEQRIRNEQNAKTKQPFNPNF